MTAAVVVPVVGDTVIEPDETFTVRLSKPTNATLKKTGAVGTILNDDQKPAAEPPPEDEFDWGRTGPPDLRPVLLAKLRDDFEPGGEGWYGFRTLAFSRLRSGRLVRGGKGGRYRYCPGGCPPDRSRCRPARRTRRSSRCRPRST